MIVALAVFFPFSTGASSQQLTVAVTDKSGEGSPLVSTGFVTISQVSLERQHAWTYEDRLSSRNLSPKPIMTIVEVLDVSYPDGTMVRDIKQYDAFFQSELINPGFSYAHQPHHQTAAVSNPDAHESREPHVEAKVIFVEFSDGTTFGDLSAAKPLLDLRQSLWQSLKDLVSVYEKGGDSAFSAALAKPAPAPEFEPVLDRLRAARASGGVPEQVARIRQMLRIANERSQIVN